MLDKSSSTAKVLKGDLKKAGMIGAGVASTAALAYGAKKLYNKNKNKDMKEQKEFSENLPMETPKVSKDKASKLRDMFNRTKDSIKNSKVGKNAADFYAKHEKGVKIGGGVAAGTALAAGLAVGAKKLADKKKEQQKEFAARDYVGLDEIGKKRLREYRNKLARDLNKERNQINSKLADDTKRLSKDWGVVAPPYISAAKEIADGNKETLRKKAQGAADMMREKERRRVREVTDSIYEHSKLADKLRAKKVLGQKLKKAGMISAGVAGAAGLAYGGKKLYDKYKKNNESDNKD